MKALSLWQPWASLMALGMKKIETRSWYMSHRGPLVICSTKTWNRDILEQLHMARKLPICDDDSDWRRMLLALASKDVSTLSDLPLGAALCVVNVIGCETTDTVRRSISEDELAFGDFSDGRWAIVTKDCKPFDVPMSVKGKQGLWDFPDELLCAK